MQEHGTSSSGEHESTLAQSIEAAASVQVPLEVTLAALAEEHDDARMAQAARRLVLRLREGATFEQAIDELGPKLPLQIGNLIRVGIESGDLAGTFERFAQQRLASRQVSRRIQSTIAYPLVIAAILVPLLLFLSLLVVPLFGDVFDEFDLDLPAITHLVLRAAEQMPSLIAGLLLFALAIPLILRLVGGAWAFHRVRAAMPVLGRLWMWSGQREFAATLAAFLELHIPLDRAIVYTSSVMGDRNVARAGVRLNERLKAGQSLGNSLEQSMHFDRSLVAFVKWGERQGLLIDSLQLAAETFEDRIEQHSAFIRRLLPPVTLIAVATMVFFVIVGLMLPLVKLVEGLGY